MHGPQTAGLPVIPVGDGASNLPTNTTATPRCDGEASSGHFLGGHIPSGHFPGAARNALVPISDNAIDTDLLEFGQLPRAGSVCRSQAYA